jgi:endo-1,4-beta-xylanase
MRLKLIPAVFLIVGIASTAVAADADARTPAAELPAIKELPNPFVFADGSPVRTKEDWNRRRAELKSLFEDYVYGHLPPKPDEIVVEPGEMFMEETDSEKPRTLAWQDNTIRLTHHGEEIEIKFRLILPMIEDKYQFPVVIHPIFRWPGRNEDPLAPERWKLFIDRGYAVAAIDYQPIAPDNNERFKTGSLHKLFSEKNDFELDCGALMAWAWTVHRVIDALEKSPAIDAQKIVVTGHSRYGKAALIAGAFDERIALTVPSHSGCAGCAPYRFIFGKSEQLHNIVGAFPYWFRPDFNQFIGNVERLPVDQHELMALVAPRAMLLTEGTEDHWINPEGAQTTYLAAKKVYEFLGAGENLSIRYRPVGHIPSNDDLLEFADHVFFNKPLSQDFGKLAYKDATEAFGWDSPPQ